MPGESGTLDVDKDSCYMILLPPSTMTKKAEPIRLALECHLCYEDPASFPIHALYFNQDFYFPLVSCNLWLRYLLTRLVQALLEVRV